MNKWEDEIRAFEEADLKRPPTQHSILFTGSSTIRLWKSLPGCFPGESVLNRGFGGACIADVTWFLPRILGAHQPKAIVFYAGGNDLASGRTVEAVIADWRGFIETAVAHCPVAHLAMISVLPHLAFWKFRDRLQEGNLGLQSLCSEYNTVEFIDVWAAFLRLGDPPPDHLFQADQIHLSDTGYQLFASTIRKAVGWHARSL